MRIMKRFHHFALAIFLLCLTLSQPVLAQERDLLSSRRIALAQVEERAPSSSIPSTTLRRIRTRTPPATPRAWPIDYLKLIAEKVGAKLEFLTPRPFSQVLADMQNGKGDVIPSVNPDPDKEQYLIFTDNYVSSPSVIVVRKDYNRKSGLNLNDFDGKQVAVVDGAALESYMRVNYPRVVIAETTDSEVSLQQVVLGEVDAAAMDVATLSYYLSKQVLNSVKIVGNTGFQSDPAFAMPKGDTVLQSILEKGLSQVSSEDRSILNDKWIAVPTDSAAGQSLWSEIVGNFSVTALYVLLGIGIAAALLLRRSSLGWHYLTGRARGVDKLKTELSGLERSHKMVAEELAMIKEEEEKLEKKIDSLDR